MTKVMLFGGVALGRGLGYEGGGLLSGINAFTKEIPESSLFPFSHVRAQQKSMNQETSPPDTTSSRPLTLDFLTFQSVRNKYLLFCHPAYTIFIIATWSKITTLKLKFFNVIVSILVSWSIFTHEQKCSTLVIIPLRV